MHVVEIDYRASISIVLTWRNVTFEYLHNRTNIALIRRVSFQFRSAITSKYDLITFECFSRNYNVFYIVDSQKSTIDIFSPKYEQYLTKLITFRRLYYLLYQ